MRDLAWITDAKTGRVSSWDRSGRNQDYWIIPAKESRVLADIQGPGAITHIWMTQRAHYRECLLKITWDDAETPSVLVPLGDFFCLGHSIVNSFQSFLFTASTVHNNRFNAGCALNCYVPMPFQKRARVELVNESTEDHTQYFYIDYETKRSFEEEGFFHAEFRRANPFSGWAPEIPANKPGSHLANIENKEKTAWKNNYLILETKGKGHYIGCNLSVTNFCGDWWGEGDDMIWVDGYKWPPDLHGTGSEDYLNQAWGMQDNAFLRNGSSIFEGNTIHHVNVASPWAVGGYQTSYVFHLENPVRFQKEIRVTIEHGHGNHLANEMSSVAYWYSSKPVGVVVPPSVEKRMPVLRDNSGAWLYDTKNQTPSCSISLTQEMKDRKKEWKASQKR
jgi:hypothetical protein